MNSKGFSVMEGLVAITIVSVGFIGISGLLLKTTSQIQESDIQINIMNAMVNLCSEIQASPSLQITYQERWKESLKKAFPTVSEIFFHNHNIEVLWKRADGSKASLVGNC